MTTLPDVKLEMTKDDGVQAVATALSPTSDGEDRAADLAPTSSQGQDLSTDSDDDTEEDWVSDLGEDIPDYVPNRKLPRATLQHRHIDELIFLLDEGWLDLEPSYQRSVVWSADRQTALISSLVDNFYVPPIIFNLQMVQDGAEYRWMRVCVDGKQRLTSIWAFVKGEIPHVDGEGKKWYFAASKNGKTWHKRLLLSEKFKHDFVKSRLACYEYRELERDQEEDLFARVQKGVQLTPAEKFRASRGAWQCLADRFENEYEDILSLCGNKRSRGWRQILEICNQIMEAHHPEGSDDSCRLVTRPDAIKKMLQAQDLCTEATKAQLDRVFLTISVLMHKDPSTFESKHLKRPKTFAPVELVAVAVLVSLHPQRNQALLLADILMIRRELREAFDDLRLNSHVWQGAWSLIKEVERIHGTTDGTTVLQGSSAASTDPNADGALPILHAAFGGSGVTNGTTNDNAAEVGYSRAANGLTSLPADQKSPRSQGRKRVQDSDLPTEMRPSLDAVVGSRGDQSTGPAKRVRLGPLG
ncbi:MAG: hypothetical protein M1817_003764 [Caeruleum heppii]|nr:MAG: hypothetical protein M1817_003764 [Caeruleum heppii]